MKKRVIFRADAGQKIGYGHFIRSLALASYLPEEFEPEFTSFNHDKGTPTDYQLNEIEKVCRYKAIEAPELEKYNEKFLSELTGDEIVVLDNYYFTAEFQRGIKEKGCRLVCVDDLHDRKMICDLLLTGMNLPRDVFDIKDSAVFLSGIEHSFLRRPFLNVRRSVKRGDIKSVVIAMGGADPYSLTDKIIEVILHLDLKLEIYVLAGDKVKIDSKYGDKVIIRRNLSAEEIVDLFTSVDMGILSASTVCIEAMACNLKTAVGWYVDNQKDLYNYGAKEHLFFPLGNLLDSLSELTERIREAFKWGKLNSEIHNIDFLRGKEDIINAFRKL